MEKQSFEEEKRFTAVCGLYCRDCIPSHPALFTAAEQLEAMLDEADFAPYAELKARKLEVFRNYAVFREVLAAIRALRCRVPCKEGGCKPDCVPRDCARRKGIEGCWECGEWRICPHLEWLKSAHGEGLSNNLAVLEADGIEGWSEKRSKHYPWR